MLTTHAEHYFELSKPDATRALAVYRTFVKQTEAVVQYLSLARSHEHSTRLEIPKIKHAPTSLAASLEEYLNDKDFEINRRQYLAEKEAKKNGGKVTNGSSKFQEPKPAPSTTSTTQPPAAPTRNPSAPLIDLFASIEDNQQTMATQPMMQQQYPQQTAFQQQGFPIPQQTDNMGFAQQQQQPFSPQSGTNPFQMQQQPQAPQIQIQPQQIQTQFTGAGFGGYTPQTFSPQNSLASIPQNGVADFSQQQQMHQHMQIPTIAEPLQSQQTSTNPFRQSILPSPTGAADPKLLNNPTGASSLGRTATNPFAKHTTGFQPSQSPTNPSPFAQPPVQPSPFAQMQQQQQPQQFQQLQPLQPLQPAPTGTNPFARQPSPQSATSPQGGLTVNATGSTNPFRQSAFVNQQTGQGWQNNGQGTLGGMNLDQVPTTNVFPRPGQQQTQNFLG
jgi:hypothetical protein